MIFQIAKKHQKLSSAVLLAVFVLVVLAGSLVSIHQAQAQGTPAPYDPSGQYGSGKTIPTPEVCGFVTGSPVECIKDGINLALQGFFYIIGIVLAFELEMLAWVLDNFSWENGVVTLGWGIVRDFSNLFFIVVIMIIAFATVLQLETYGMKALLPKLIAIALLINFSLAICGFLINFADAFGKTFKDAGKGGPALTLAVKTGLGAGNLTSDGTATAKGQQEADEKIKELAKKGSQNTFLAVVLSFALGILSGLIMIFVIGAGIFFMMIRQISLMFIVILSPIALICLLVPFLNDKWSEWKSAFLKWVLFYPLYMFFFYIAIKIINSNVMSAPGMGGSIKGVTGITSPQAIWRMFIASMFLIGAIMVAQKTGVAGASAIGSFGKGALKTITGAGLAQKGLKMAGARVKEEVALRRAQIGARIAPTATMRREAELRTKGIEKKREKDFMRLVEYNTDPKKGKLGLTETGEYLAKKYANNPTSRYHKLSVKALAGEWRPPKAKPLTAEDVERLEKKLSEKIS